MSTNPFDDIVKFSALISGEMSRRHPGVKYPTNVLGVAREHIAREVRNNEFAVRKELESLDSELQGAAYARAAGILSDPPTRSPEGLEAGEALSDWLAHLQAARHGALIAHRAEVAALHELWKQLAEICDAHLGLGKYDWAFD